MRRLLLSDRRLFPQKGRSRSHDVTRSRSGRRLFAASPSRRSLLLCVPSAAPLLHRPPLSLRLTVRPTSQRQHSCKTGDGRRARRCLCRHTAGAPLRQTALSAPWTSRSRTVQQAARRSSKQQRQRLLRRSFAHGIDEPAASYQTTAACARKPAQMRRVAD